MSAALKAELAKLEQQAQHYADLAREAHALWAEPTNTEMQRRVYVSRILDAKGNEAAARKLAAAARRQLTERVPA